MGGQHENLGYLDMGRRAGCIVGHVCNVVARERLDAFIHAVRTCVIAMEADVAEVGFDQSRLDVRHADAGICGVNAQPVGDGLHRSLCAAVDVSVGVSGIAGY